MIPALDDYAAITATIGHYWEGARTGDIARMKRAFHPDAWIFGFLGEESFCGPILILFEWDEKVGPAPDIAARVTAIDIAGSAASARLEIDHWLGHRFTDFFNLVKFGGDWLIVNKIFHLHYVDPAASPAAREQ